MAKKSAGILLYRRRKAGLEVMLVHPGGPFWAKKDLGAWSIPKGEYDDGEEPETAARREFLEELGIDATATLIPLGEVKQKAGKIVVAFGMEGDFDVATIRSNTFEMEWPPKSGKRIIVPEVDRAGWFGITEGREKILAGQAPLLDRLAAVVPLP
jgi:predicted NUDIX family NTP pyrophosphohydrolase